MSGSANIKVQHHNKIHQILHFLKDLGFVCLESEVSVKPPSTSPAALLERLRQEVLKCKKCDLWKTRTHVVFGEGSPSADLVFIGEAPGEKEDLQGRPFVGPAGGLLSHYFAQIGLSRKEVFISNILKCRPPDNRDPNPDEISACEPHLLAQLKILQPKVICTLGRYASNALLGLHLSMSEMRGKIYTYHGIKVLPTFHPASLLYHPANKELFEEDFRRLRAIYDEINKCS